MPSRPAHELRFLIRRSGEIEQHVSRALVVAAVLNGLSDPVAGAIDDAVVRSLRVGMHATACKADQHDATTPHSQTFMLGRLNWRELIEEGLR